MRITANLLQAPPRRPLRASAALWLAALLLLGLAAWIHAGTRQHEEEVEVLRERVAHLGQQLAAIPVTELPPRHELDALRTRLAAINASTTARGMGAAPLLTWLEDRLPTEVRLVSLELKARDGEVLVVAESTSEPALTALLRRLEGEPRFRDVLLSRQASRSASTNGLRVEIRFRQKG